MIVIVTIVIKDSANYQWYAKQNSEEKKQKIVRVRENRKESVVPLHREFETPPLATDGGLNLRQRPIISYGSQARKDSFISFRARVFFLFFIL